MEREEFFEERLKKAQRVLARCYASLGYYKENIRPNYAENKEEMIGKPIYDRQKNLLEGEKSLKEELAKKIALCSLEDIDDIMEILKKHSSKNNENFVDSFIDFLREHDDKKMPDRLGNEIVLDLFASFVEDQKSLSEVDVDFYKTVLERISQLESFSENE